MTINKIHFKINRYNNPYEFYTIYLNHLKTYHLTIYIQKEKVQINVYSSFLTVTSNSYRTIYKTLNESYKNYMNNLKGIL